MKIVREYSRGKRPYTEFRVTVAGLRLVAVAAFHRALVQRNGREPERVAYISVIGVDKHFRGERKNGRRPGDHALTDLLHAIYSNPDFGPSIPVIALVDPNNEHSCKLFKRHGFTVVQEAPPDDPEADCVLERPPGPPS
jgi:ribosomal protein S18 acetylase RimI-like enzyme